MYAATSPSSVPRWTVTPARLSTLQKVYVNTPLMVPPRFAS